MILAIKLPDDLKNDSLISISQHPKLGRLLYFDPTNPFTPFGQIGGYLQANYGLLVTPEGGELVGGTTAVVGHEQHSAGWQANT